MNKTRMATTHEPNDGRGRSEVVGAVDGEGASREFVIADITTDDAWIAVQAEDARSLSAWR